MRYSKKWDRVFSTTSWILVLVLFYASFAVFMFPPSVEGPVAQLIGVKGAEIFYSILYAVSGALLAYSKIFKKKKMRKQVLMFIYLVGMFTSILTIGLVGIGFSLWDNAITTVIAAGCWLYWKFKTEYIDPKAFDDEIWHLREDTPAP